MRYPIKEAMDAILSCMDGRMTIGEIAESSRVSRRKVPTDVRSGIAGERTICALEGSYLGISWRIVASPSLASPGEPLLAKLIDIIQEARI